MSGIADIIIDTVDAFVAWASGAVKQTMASYCEIQTADSPTVLVSNEGSLISILKIDGVKALIGAEEFEHIRTGLMHTLQTSLARSGHTIQVYFSYNRDEVGDEISHIFEPAKETAKLLSLSLDDLFNERVTYLSKYCAHEDIFLVLWTRPGVLTAEQLKRAFKEKQQGWIWAFGTAACAYNPIIPPDITRHLWASFHIIAAAVSGLSIFYMKTNTNLEKTS